MENLLGRVTVLIEETSRSADFTPTKNDEFTTLNAKANKLLSRAGKNIKQRNELKKTQHEAAAPVITLTHSIRVDLQSAEKIAQEARNALDKDIAEHRLPKEELDAREQLLEALFENIRDYRSLNDSIKPSLRPTAGSAMERSALFTYSQKYQAEGGSSTSNNSRTAEPSKPLSSDEVDQMLQTFEKRRENQTQQLDALNAGVLRLKDQAGQIHVVLQQHNQLIDQANTKADRVNAHTVSVNKKLKKTLEEVRTTERVCVHAVLIFILLGLLSYIWRMFTSKD